MGDVLLELLNSRPVIDGVERDALADPTEGRAWARARGGDGTVAELRLLRAARDALTDVVIGAAPAAALTPLLEGVERRPAVDAEGLRWELSAPPHARLAVETVLAWAAVEEEMPGRLRACANSDCRRFLLDRSRANQARWCSMAVCGNRAKARRHYQRTH